MKRGAFFRFLAVTLILSLTLSLLLTSCKKYGRGASLNGGGQTAGGTTAGDTSAGGGTGDETGGETGGETGDESAGGESGGQTNSSPEYQPYVWPEDQLVNYNGLVEHLFFHQIIAYPELAFDGDAQEKGFDDWMVTVSEFNKIMESLYEKGYILVDMNDVWVEKTDENGVAYMAKNTLRIPQGKKPLIISIDDTCYYQSYMGNGFMEKLVLGDDGEIWAWGHDPQGNEVLTQELDIIPAIDTFVKKHPDFSLNGVKACLSLTGYEGIFGYRTNTDSHGLTPEQEAYRQSEIEAVKPIVEQLKKTGWYFGCHTWGHIRLDSSRYGVTGVAADMQRWQSDVGDIVGPTKLLFYPHGGRPDGDDWHKTGEVFKYLHSLGYRIFASVGTQSFSYIKKDISAVICDRLHPDGTTLRHLREQYLQFYDAKDVFDYEWRPEKYGMDF